MPQQLEENDLIKTLNPNDVLCGRGSGPNDYRGNIKFRNMVYERRAEYLASTTRKAKGQIAQEIIDQFRTNFHPAGRFLKKVDLKTAKALGITRGNEVWVQVDDDTALEKAKQALRQNRDYANGGNKVNGDFNRDSCTSKNKKNPQSMIGNNNAHDIMHTYPVPHNEVLSSQISLHGAEHISNNFFPPSADIRPYTAHHRSSLPQEHNYQNMSYERQDLYAAQHRQTVGRFQRRNTIGGETVSWDNYNNGRQSYHQDYNRIDRQQFRPDGMVSSSLHMSNSRFPPVDMSEFSEHSAIGYAHMDAGIDEIEKQKLGFDKGVRCVNKFGDDQNEMYLSDTESKHRGRGRGKRRLSKDEAGSRILADTAISHSLRDEAGSNLSRNEVGSSSLRVSELSHPQETSSMEFRTSSESSGLGMTFEQYQVLAREEESSPERVRSGSVSTMGTIDIPKKYVFQLPQTVLDSSLGGGDSKGRHSHSRKMSGRSVLSIVSSGSTVKSSLFSESEMSVSEVSHDLDKLKSSSQNNRKTIIDTTAIQNEEGKIKTNLRWTPTTPRLLADMEDEPDELSSLGETSLTILQAAMDASICSTASNYTSGFDSVSEYDE